MLNAAFENGRRKVGRGEHLSDAVSQLNFDSGRVDGMVLKDGHAHGHGHDDEQQPEDDKDPAAPSNSRRQRSSVDSIPVFFLPICGHRSRKPIL